MKKYIPIACEFYDHIEIWAMSKKKVHIRYLDHSQKELTITEVIKDTQTTKEGEFMILQDGTRIRMDFLISIEDKNLKDFSSCQI